MPPFHLEYLQQNDTNAGLGVENFILGGFGPGHFPHFQKIKNKIKKDVFNIHFKPF